MTIYFVSAGHRGPIKIGFTSGEPSKRIAELQVGCPFPLMLIGSVAGTMTDERMLLDELKQHRVSGEWFAHGAVLPKIKTVLSTGFKPRHRVVSTFEDVISAFGGPSKFAEAIGIEPFHAGSMKTRGSIPSTYWSDIVAAAVRFALVAEDDGKRSALQSVTLEALAEIAKAKRPAHCESECAA